MYTLWCSTSESCCSSKQLHSQVFCFCTGLQCTVAAFQLASCLLKLATQPNLRLSQYCDCRSYPGRWCFSLSFSDRFFLQLAGFLFLCVFFLSIIFYVGFCYILRELLKAHSCHYSFRNGTGREKMSCCESVIFDSAFVLVGHLPSSNSHLLSLHLSLPLSLSAGLHLPLCLAFKHEAIVAALPVIQAPLCCVCK